MTWNSVVLRRWWVAFATSAALVALTACSAVTPTAGTPDPTTAELLARVNAVRVAGRSCGAEGSFAPTRALAFDARLTTAAQAHAADMAARNVMSHIGGDGSDVGTRIARTGYVASTWGENVAFGYPDVDAVMAGWLGSDGHCANLMYSGFTEFGAGESNRFWAQVFARPQ